jgi:hypothetical protein
VAAEQASSVVLKYDDLQQFHCDNMSASPRERTESKVLATKVAKDEAFAEGTKWSQRAFFYKNATESIRAGRPLAARIYYFRNGRGMVSVFSDFGGGSGARAVQVDEAGNLSFAKSRVGSTDSTRVENAVDKGKRLADVSEVLANTEFLEANPGELIVFGSKNAATLTGGKEIENGFYLTVQKNANLKALLAEQLTEKRKEVAELERKLEAATKAEKDEVQ